MSIRFACPACERKLKLAESFAGRRIKCPACESVVRVPNEPDAVSPAVAGSSGRTEARVPGQPRRETPGTRSRLRRKLQSHAEFDDLEECHDDSAVPVNAPSQVVARRARTSGKASGRSKQQAVQPSLGMGQAGLILLAVLNVIAIPLNVVSWIVIAAADPTSQALVIVIVVGVLTEVGMILGMVLTTAGSRWQRSRLVGHFAAILRFLSVVAVLLRYLPGLPPTAVMLAVILSLGFRAAGFVVFTEFLRGLAKEGGHDTIASRARFTQIGTVVGVGGVVVTLLIIVLTKPDRQAAVVLLGVASIFGFLGTLATLAYVVLLILLAMRLKSESQSPARPSR